MQYFNIQVASQLSGVASATIRAWEKRYNAVVPERGENKHRLYSEKDIEKLALLFRLTEVGQSIGKVAHLQLDELKHVYTMLLHEPYVEKQVVTPHHDKVDYHKIMSNLLLAVAAYKVDIISHELEKARTQLPPRELCLNIVVPLMHELKNLNMTQERALSSLTSFSIGQMISSHYQKVFHGEELILIGNSEGEFDESGILAASLLCIHYNLRFIFMGSNLNADSLVQAANVLNCKSIILGKTQESYLKSLESQLAPKTEIWVMGNMDPVFKLELQRRKLSFFPTLQSLDTFLS